MFARQVRLVDRSLNGQTDWLRISSFVRYYDVVLEIMRLGPTRIALSSLVATNALIDGKCMFKLDHIRADL